MYVHVLYCVGLGTNDSDSTPSFSKNGTRKKVTRKVKRKKSAASKKIGGTSSKNTARKTSQPARRSEYSEENFTTC